MDAFYNACRTGDLNTVVNMVAEGVDTQKRDQNKALLPIEIASYYGNINIVEYFISIKLPIADSLYWTAHQGWNDLVKYLLSLSDCVNINYVYGNSDRTPLHAACSQKNIDTVELLLQAGAIVNVADKYGNTPLHIASGSDVTNLHIMNQLIIYGVDINSSNNDGYTALHLLCDRLYNHAVGLDLLINIGAHINTINYKQETPLATAVRLSHIETIITLLVAGADPNYSYNDRTILITACVYGNCKVVELLLIHGADPNLASCGGCNPLHTAIKQGNEAIVQILLEKGANPNNKNSVGNSALYNAVAKKRTDIMKLLLDFGADVNIKNDKGFTPLINAAINNSLDAVEMLLAFGADVSIVCANGKSAFSYTEREKIRNLVSF
jgi:uncharacterized protein